MKSEKICISSKTLELAETQTYIELTNRLCYYGEPNYNGVCLPIDGAEDKAETLVNQPVVAKYKKINNKDDLGGHEVKINPITDEITFGTENVGTHTSVEVKKDTVDVLGEEKELPCLFATSRVWTRNKNVVNAIKRLFEEGKLYTSWEILVNSYKFQDGIKILDDYIFEANALLGSNSAPAYGGCASTLSVAEVEESENIIAEALATDMNEKEEDEKLKTKKDVVATTDKVEETVIVAEPKVDESEITVTETIKDVAETSIEDNKGDSGVEVDSEGEPVISDMTTSDLYMTLAKKCREKCKSTWLWVSFVFPEEHYCLCEYDGRPSELSYYKFTYDVLESDAIEVSEPEEIKLVVSMAEVNEAIASRDKAILKANEDINDLKAEIETLAPFKEEHDKAEMEAKKSVLVKKAKKSGLIAEKELSEEGNEVFKAISELNEDALNTIIVERIINKPNTSEAIIETSTANLEVEEESMKNIVDVFLGK